jgi:hypothetical protein
MALHEEVCCREVIGDLSSAYLENTLDETSRQSLEQHLLICPGCSAYLEQLQESVRLLSRLGPARQSPAAAPRPAQRSGVIENTTAYKFLRRGRIAPFAKVQWPPPHDSKKWIGGDVVHACRVRHLPYWLNEELWHVELEGDVAEQGWALLATRGRLLARVEGWPDAKQAFAADCAEVARGAAADVLKRKRLDAEATTLLATDWGELPAFVDGTHSLGGDARARAAVQYAVEAGRSLRDAPGVAFVAAAAAAHAEGTRAAAAEERGRQARWLAEHLCLTDVPGSASADPPRPSRGQGTNRAPCAQPRGQRA